MAEVKIYVTQTCPYCVRARGLLTRKNIPFTVIDVGGDASTRAWLLQATGRHTVPQIFIDGQPIGGSDDLHALDRSGELDRMLARTS